MKCLREGFFFFGYKSFQVLKIILFTKESYQINKSKLQLNSEILDEMKSPEDAQQWCPLQNLNQK